MPIINPKRTNYPTTKQKNFLLILFNDLGFNFAARGAYLSDLFKRRIIDLDDLTSNEARLVINKLKEIKDAP